MRVKTKTPNSKGKYSVKQDRRMCPKVKPAGKGENVQVGVKLNDIDHFTQDDSLFYADDMIGLEALRSSAQATDIKVKPKKIKMMPDDK